MQLGFVLLQMGEMERYREHCRALLAQWGSTKTNITAEQVLRTCLMHPDSMADAQQLARLAEVAVSGTKNRAWYEWWLFAKGLHDYRTGKYSDALVACKEVLRRLPEAKSPVKTDDVQAMKTMALALEALALHQSGNKRDAQQVLQKARANLRLHVPGIDTAVWHDWVAARLLQQEAEVLIGVYKDSESK